MDNANSTDQPSCNVNQDESVAPEQESAIPTQYLPQTTPENMASTFISPPPPQQFLPFAPHRNGPQTFIPVAANAIQRSPSVGLLSQPNAFNMGTMQRTLSAHLPHPHPQQHSQQPPPPPQQQQQAHPPSHPHSNTRQQSSQRFQTGPSTAALAYQLSQQIQYQTPATLNESGYYGQVLYQAPTGYYDPYGHYTMAHDPASHNGTFQVPYSSSYPPHSAPLTGPQWYPQSPPYYPVPPMNTGYPVQVPPQMQQYQYQNYSQSRRHSVPVQVHQAPRVTDTSIRKSPNTSYSMQGPQNMLATPSNAEQSQILSQASSTPSLPRGPPRKPKQSGNALWVGNLPPEATVGELKDHFSRDAKQDIQSVFLISKSNCAFVNYRTEAACNDAKDRFHDSKFHKVKLVCRLRRSSTPAAGSPQPPPTPKSPGISAEASGDEDASAVESTETSDTAVKSPPSGPAGPKPRPDAKDRYFIVKSLTVEDLELSVKNGAWATQSHNEAALNKAYDAAENVYLIFSANKSGEYYGYARMTSRITDNSSISWMPTSQAVDTTLPKSIFTAETETAPKGRIIDDSSRGTIFWEALNEGAGEDVAEAKDNEEEPNTWGTPFKVQWMSTARVPFYRTRGLRNQWNSNREVKIARDGTELEESVGRRLIQMFQRNVNV
ncbi:YT521-B-like domain-containing protein [Geopyxis carbonaria]|nr:YT521-B-like domain-containing protein [Geopyxis carbonaria]